MSDAMHERQVTTERFKSFLQETEGEAVAAAILTLCVTIQEWSVSATDAEGKLNVNVSGHIIV